MNYRLDKRRKEKQIIIACLCLGIFFLFIIITTSLGHVFGGIFMKIAKPFWQMQTGIENSFSNSTNAFKTKKALHDEIILLREKNDEANALLYGMQALTVQNKQLQEILGRKSEEQNLIVGAILAKPNRTPYDTLVIDVGNKHGITKGALVFAYGNIPIGRIQDVFSQTSRVTLFSAAGQITPIVLADSNVAGDLVGRGGGNFELILQRDIAIVENDVVYMPGFVIEPVAIVGSIISDLRDPFQKVLLTSPVNIQHLNLVEVEQSTNGI